MHDRERGATMVEAALVLPIVLLAIVAVLEFGMAFKNWLSVSHAAREGARAGATFGNDIRADILILDEVAQTMAAAAGTSIKHVEIYNPQTGVGTTYTYTPGSNCNGPDCCDWTPCPDPDLPTPPYVVPVWDPVTRDVSAPVTDRLGVSITYDHSWITGMFATSSTFTTAVEFQIEPQIFE